MKDLSDGVVASGRRNHKRFRLPMWVRGMLFGQAIWGIAVFGMFVFGALESRVKTFPLVEFVDTLGTVCAVVAMPLMLGGWLIWGEKVNSMQWLNSITLHLGFGAFFYGLIGAFVATLISKLRFRQR